jgi:hypothetical protein
MVFGAVEVKPITDAQASEYELDPKFFKKGTMAQGILIATSEKVGDYALLEAAYQITHVMSALKPGFGDRIREAKPIVILVAHNENVSDIPQFTTDKTGKELDFYNWRNRGFLTLIGKRPAILAAEEDILEYEGGMQSESILIHEFAHLVHRPGFPAGFDDDLKNIWQATKDAGTLWNDGFAAQKFRRVTSPTPVLLVDELVKSFSKQSRELFEKSLEGGDILVNGKASNSKVMVTKDDKVLIVFGGSKSCYAMTNRAEYFAEIVQAWFNTNRTMDHDHNHIDTREELKSYDSNGCGFVERVFKDEPWAFISPRRRAGTEHLKGYDPQQAPVVEDNDFIKDAANDYYDEYWTSYWQRLKDKHTVK